MFPFSLLFSRERLLSLILVDVSEIHSVYVDAIWIHLLKANHL
jgi:hypothetical protein